jgi:hypothetical protein
VYSGPLLNVFSPPQPSHGQFGHRFREVGVATDELSDPLAAHSENLRDFLKTNWIAAHVDIVSNA